MAEPNHEPSDIMTHPLSDWRPFEREDVTLAADATSAWTGESSDGSASEITPLDAEHRRAIAIAMIRRWAHWGRLGIGGHMIGSDSLFTGIDLVVR